MIRRLVRAANHNEARKRKRKAKKKKKKSQEKLTAATRKQKDVALLHR